MRKFSVHLFTQVRVTVTGVQAESIDQAMEKAESAVDLNDLLNNRLLQASPFPLGNGVSVKSVEWAEACPDLFLVDPLLEDGEVDFENTGWFGPDCLPLIDGNTTIEQKAKNADLAAKFMQELLDSVESLTGIAEEHGSRTLADLMYLQLAITKGSFIDHHPDESKVLDIARSLPSGEQWGKFIKVEDMAQSKDITSCSECGEHVDSIVGCPDGSEVCQQCFDASSH